MFSEPDVQPCTLVIFGATGDLTQRKLMPGLYALLQEQLLPRRFAVIGFARSAKTNEEFRAEMRQAVKDFARYPLDDALWTPFAEGLYYHRSAYDEAVGYGELQTLLQEVGERHGTLGHTIYYLATPPEPFNDIIHYLHDAGLSTVQKQPKPWPRIVVEKPFGHDLQSAKDLNAHFRQAFDEVQSYRIDHYLGKETVQNIMALRFANGIFEPLWNEKYIDHIQITANETLGVEERGGYYDTSGALRDMMQNHLLQLMTLTAMEPPGTLRADAIRNEKLKVLESIRPLHGEAIDRCVVRGQYGAGRIAGQDRVAYRDEPRVKPDSTTETYVAMKLHIDNWRWSGVPFYLRSGKNLAKHVSEIAIQFKPVPQILFRATTPDGIEPNVLVLRIQPDEGASLTMASKAPGLQVQLQTVEMDFQYGTSFGVPSPEGYERLLHDVMLGDQTLFMRSDEVEAAWKLMTPILEHWADRNVSELPTYPAGSWGPREADALLANDGFCWRQP
jgi:glucose-6-phosphate 1-dehydrogenase